MNCKYSFQKIIDVFVLALNVLDFSFLISGAGTLGILYVGLKYYIVVEWIQAPSCFWDTCVFIICTYICGLFSWGGGKVIRRNFPCLWKCSDGKYDYDCYIEERIKWISKAIIPSSMLENRIIAFPSISYAAMWTLVSQKEEIKERYNFINKYWVMQAIFEGLIGTGIMGVVMVWWIFYNSIEVNYISINIMINYVALTVFFVFLIYISFRESQKYVEQQIKEVVINYCIHILGQEFK